MRRASTPPTTTLVLLMGVRLLRDSAAALVASGRAPTTPVAIVERGWTAAQRTTVGHARGHRRPRESARGVESPAVVVVGDVVALRDRLGPFSPERCP